MNLEVSLMGYGQFMYSSIVCVFVNFVGKKYIFSASVKSKIGGFAWGWGAGGF